MGGHEVVTKEYKGKPTKWTKSCMVSYNSSTGSSLATFTYTQKLQLQSRGHEVSHDRANTTTMSPRRSHFTMLASNGAVAWLRR